MNHLGICADLGAGVEQNSTKAVEWYTKAAKKGFRVAMYTLGVCFEYGRGVERNWTKAVEWYTKAAEKGCTRSIAKLERALG